MSHEHGSGSDMLDSGAKDGFMRIFAFLSFIPQVIFTFTSDDEKNRMIARQHAAVGGGGGHH
jgi:hypothetical protein